MFPFFDSDVVTKNFGMELPVYLVAAEDVFFEGDSTEKGKKKVGWWRDHSQDLLHWSAAAKKVFLVQPSSAAAKRVFSLLAATFTNQQVCAPQDYLETSLMVCYNKQKS